MSREHTRRVDAIRAQSSELQNHLIDEYKSGHINRREFVRAGTVIGMSMPLVSFLAAACGTGDKSGGSGGGGAPTPRSRPAASRSRSSRAGR